MTQCNYPQIRETEEAWEFVLEFYDFIYQGKDCSGSAFWNIHLGERVISLAQGSLG